MTRLVALISGRGSNLKAIIDATACGDLPVSIQAVISNRPQAPGLLYAQDAGIATHALDHQAFSARALFDRELQKQIDDYQADLVILAGFMRILSAFFVEHYRGRLLNIHPSLLPKFPGLDTHKRALAAGEREHGASVHFVTPELDGGPVIVQARVPVLADDDADTLGARVLEQEHRLYPLAIRWFAEKRIRLRQNQVWFDDTLLQQPRLLI